MDGELSRWRMEDGGWRMEDGGWRMEDGGHPQVLPTIHLEEEEDHHTIRKRSLDQQLRIKLYYDESVYRYQALPSSLPFSLSHFLVPFVLSLFLSSCLIVLSILVLPTPVPTPVLCQRPCRPLWPSPELDKMVIIVITDHGKL